MLADPEFRVKSALLGSSGEQELSYQEGSAPSCSTELWGTQYAGF
jgi:hypothetical protein